MNLAFCPAWWKWSPYKEAVGIRRWHENPLVDQMCFLPPPKKMGCKLKWLEDFFRGRYIPIWCFKFHVGLFSWSKSPKWENDTKIFDSGRWNAFLFPRWLPPSFHFRIFSGSRSKWRVSEVGFGKRTSFSPLKRVPFLKMKRWSSKTINFQGTC